MLEPVYRTRAFVCQLVACLPIGTSLGIARLLWTVLSGQLLPSRGALFPALAQSGLSEQATRQAQAALREGKWTIARLLRRFGWLVHQEGSAKRVSVGGWRPLLLDWVGFFRPRLSGCTSRHFDSAAGKGLPAIELGMVACVRQVRERRIPVLVALNRTGHTVTLLHLAKEKQGKADVLIADRQVKVTHLYEAGITRFVVRGQQNLCARKSHPAPGEAGKRGRKPTRGSVVRPTPRCYKERILPATVPDREECFVYQGRRLVARWFEGLVVSGCPLVISCLVVEDPRYKNPWVLVTDLEKVSAEVVYLLYRSRWHIEQLPQTGKQILGGHRSFVHGSECRYRLPEVCLLAASLSLYLSATCNAMASGFWDRHPKRTPGRFRRVLARAGVPQFEEVAASNGRVRQKRSVHGHLLKGREAHARQPKSKMSNPVTGK